MVVRCSGGGGKGGGGCATQDMVQFWWSGRNVFLDRGCYGEVEEGKTHNPLHIPLLNLSHALSWVVP